MFSKLSLLINFIMDWALFSWVLCNYSLVSDYAMKLTLQARNIFFIRISIFSIGNGKENYVRTASKIVWQLKDFFEYSLIF